jgi:hypothetical protein
MLPNQFNSLKILSECPVCRRKHFPAEIKVIDEFSDGHLLHIKCKSCDSCVLVNVTVNEQGMNMLGLLTDLGSEEIRSFSERDAVSADDVINLYQSLEKNTLV